MLKHRMLRFDGVRGTFKSYAYAFSMVCVPFGDFYRPFYISHFFNFGLSGLFKATTPKLLRVANYA